MSGQAEDFRVSVSIRVDAPYSSPRAMGNLQVSEDFNLPARSFMELAGILGQFHQLAEKIRAEAAHAGHVHQCGCEICLARCEAEGRPVDG